MIFTIDRMFHAFRNTHKIFAPAALKEAERKKMPQKSKPSAIFSVAHFTCSLGVEGKLTCNAYWYSQRHCIAGVPRSTVAIMQYYFQMITFVGKR